MIPVVNANAISNSRYRLAQAVASSDTTPDILVTQAITSPGWRLIVVLVVAGFVAWLFLKSYKRKVRSPLGLDDKCDCNTTNIGSEKVDVGIFPDKGDISRPSFHRQLRRNVSRNIVLTVMLIIVFSIIWLCSCFVMPSLAVLEVFQVYQPVSDTGRDGNGSACYEEILLLDHVFGYSYGHPFVGTPSS